MASVYPLFKLTSAPDTAATVLFDFNDVDTPNQQIYVNNSGFSLGTPALEGDPDSIFPQYGPRTVSFGVSIIGSRTYAMGKVSAAARRLLRDNCWLMFQLNSLTKPVWFRLYRPQPGDLSFEGLDLDRSKNTWTWQVALPAEPFALGARFTFNPITVNNDVAASSNPCFAQIPAVVGDAPAPARVRISHNLTQSGRRHMLSVTPAAANMAAPIVWQVGGTDGWTVGTDTGVSTASTAYSGGTYRPVTFATPGMATRLSGAAPAALPAGRYKVAVRVGRSDTSSTFQVQFGVNGGFTYKYNDPVSLTWPASTAVDHTAWIDLGEVRLPQGNPIDDLSQETQLVTPDVSLQAARLSGTGELRLDAFLVIPLESDYARTTFIDWASAAPSAAILSREFIDAELEAVYSRFSTNDALTTLELPSVSGGWPLLVPGENNVLHVLEQTSPSRAKVNFIGTADAPDQLATVKTFVISYQPRWLFIGDGS